MPARPPPPETCAQCGAEIPRGARACPHCGADERTGWREDSPYDGLDLPEEAWTDDEAARTGSRRGRHGLRWYWLALGILILLAFALQALRLWTFGWLGR